MSVDIPGRKKLIHAMPLNTDRAINRAMVVRCAISATRNYLKLHMPRTLNPLLRNIHAETRKLCKRSAVRCCRLSTRCRPSIHQLLVDALRVAAQMPCTILGFHDSDMRVASHERRAYHRPGHWLAASAM